MKLLSVHLKQKKKNIYFMCDLGNSRAFMTDLYYHESTTIEINLYKSFVIVALGILLLLLVFVMINNAVVTLR